MYKLGGYFTPTLIALFILQSTSRGDVILTFDTPTATNQQPIDQAYGDHVTALSMGGFSYGQMTAGFTPNVETTYINLFHWDNEFGDLSNVLFPGSDQIIVGFSADPGFDVLLHGFDLAGWLNSDFTIPSVTVTNESNATLFSMSNILVQGDFSGSRHTHFEFGSPLRASELVISIDTGTAGQNVGIDNIRISQLSAVPEPSSGLLAAAALCILTLNRTGRQQYD